MREGESLRTLESSQRSVESALAVLQSIQVQHRYSTVLNGLALTLPAGELATLESTDGVLRVYPNVGYRALRSNSPGFIGAPALWGQTLSSAGNGVKIGIIDDGLDKTHPYFSARGYRMPPGFPKGQKSLTSAKVIVARAFAPRTPKWKYSKRAFDPLNSDHATHVAGIAAGNHRTQASGSRISGVAPKAYLGNYKVLTVPSGFGLNGNSAEIVAGIEAAVRDGMDVINLSLGEAEIEPSRDIVAAALDGAAAAGVVPVVAAGNNFEEHGAGSVTSPGSSDRAITVAAESETGGAVVATFSSGGPTPYSLRMKPDVTAPGVNVLSSSRAAWASGRTSAARAWRRLMSRARRLSCINVIAPGRLRRSSRRSCRRVSRCCEARSRRSRHGRAAGRSTSSARTRRCSSPRRPVSRSATSCREGQPWDG